MTLQHKGKLHPLVCKCPEAAKPPLLLLGVLLQDFMQAECSLKHQLRVTYGMKGSEKLKTYKRSQFGWPVSPCLKHLTIMWKGWQRSTAGCGACEPWAEVLRFQVVQKDLCCPWGRPLVMCGSRGLKKWPVQMEMSCKIHAGFQRLRGQKECKISY